MCFTYAICGAVRIMLLLRLCNVQLCNSIVSMRVCSVRRLDCAIVPLCDCAVVRLCDQTFTRNISSGYLFRISLQMFSSESPFRVSLPEISEDLFFKNSPPMRCSGYIFRISLQNVDSECLFRIYLPDISSGYLFKMSPQN